MTGLAIRYAARVSPRLLLCAVALIVVGCDPGTEREARERLQRQLKPTYDEETGKLQRLEYDADQNGTVELSAFMDGTRLIRLEADENQDGVVDRWEYYGPLPPGARPSAAAPARFSANAVLERIERATHGNGRVSRWERFEQGVLASVEEDVDGDGRVDKWETYEAGVLSVLELDTVGRGRPDRRMLYGGGQGGQMVRVEVDPDGTGVFRPVDESPRSMP